MANFKAYTFKPNHFEGFNPQEKQVQEYGRLREHGEAMTDYLESECNTVSIQRNDETIAIFGIIPLPNNGCHGWLFFGDDVKGADLVIAVRMLRGSMEALQEIGYDWIQTPVRKDFPQGERMVKMIGFKETEIEEDLMDDGTMYKYWMRVF